MSSWSRRRRFVYAIVVLGGGLLVAISALYISLNKASTCFDGKRNGGESGVDCGGACSRVCLDEVASLAIQWSRALRVSDGRYNAVAYVENPNTGAGVRSISYRFDLFDANNILITSREGETYLSPRGVSPIFEANIETGNRIPARTFFEFTEEPVWFKAVDTRDRLAIQGRELTQLESAPRIEATLRNSSAVDEFENIDVTAVVFDTDGNAIAASRTRLPLLEPRASFPLVFTWPEPFEKNVERCLHPTDTVLLFDTSGSMNNDSSEPPQPITDAKAAAQSFVDRLSSNDRVGLVSFATDAMLEHELSFSHPSVEGSLEGLSVLPEEEEGGTNIGGAIAVAFDELFNIGQDRVGAANLQKAILLLTDGKANVPAEPGGEAFATSKAREAKAAGMTLYTIGLGSEVNEVFLRDIASSPEHYHQASSVADLGQIYRSISESLCERGPAVIDIIPRTPSAFGDSS